MQTIDEPCDRLVDRAARDEGFRARLLADPNSAVESELGLRIPEGFPVVVHEENDSTRRLILPPSSQLDDADLEQVTAGFDTAPPPMDR